MNYTQLSECPPSYTTPDQSAPPPPPPPVAGGVQVAFGSPSLQHNPTAGPMAVSYTSPKRTYENYHGRQSIGLGVTMIFAGVLCVIFNIVSLLQIKYHVSVMGYGIWSGVMFIITGIFGVVVAKKKTTCKIIAFMVLCIVSSAFCLILFILSIIGAYSVEHSYPCYRYNNNYYFYGTTVTPIPPYPSECSTVKVLEAFIACLALIVAICTIWGSVLCCKVVCCGANTGQVILPIQYIPAQGNQQMIFYPMQQVGPQGSNTGIIVGGDMPCATGGPYNMPGNFPYNPQQYGQGPPIYNEHKVPL